MTGTKERILLTALRLFARDGYEAVSVSDIAGELGMTKGALYKHYASKRDIFDSLLRRMEQRDAEQAREHGVPEGRLSEMEEAYRETSIDDLTAFGKAMFRYWTQDEFAAAFRRMLTLEQFRSAEMGALYQQLLAAGPLGYMTDLFTSLALPQPEREAAAFYAPLFLGYSVYDGAAEKEPVLAAVDAHLEERRRALRQLMRSAG